MKRAFVVVALAAAGSALAVPAAQGVQHRTYFAGIAGKDPGVRVGFAVDGDKARQIFFSAKRGEVSCVHRDGSKANPSGIFSAFGRADIADDGFAIDESLGRKRLNGPHARRKIDATLADASATGTTRHVFVSRRIVRGKHGPPHLSQKRYCDTGLLHWRAEKVSRAEFRKFFGQPLHNDSSKPLARLRVR